MATAGDYKVLSTMVVVRDPETKKKRRYYTGEKVHLDATNAARLMNEDGHESTRPPSVEPWRDAATASTQGAQQEEAPTSTPESKAVKSK